MPDFLKIVYFSSLFHFSLSIFTSYASFHHFYSSSLFIVLSSPFYIFLTLNFLSFYPHPKTIPCYFFHSIQQKYFHFSPHCFIFFYILVIMSHIFPSFPIYTASLYVFFTLHFSLFNACFSFVFCLFLTSSTFFIISFYGFIFSFLVIVCVFYAILPCFYPFYTVFCHCYTFYCFHFFFIYLYLYQFFIFFVHSNFILHHFFSSIF